jgi:DNA-binding winged helix-turn-helix (wHTH) protein
VPRYRFSDFRLSPQRRLLVQGGRELPLIPRYFDLLVFLIERRHQAVHRREIFDRVWNDVIVSDSALSQAIRTLRRVLGDDPRDPRFIRTVSRHGYQFIFAHVVEEDDEAPPQRDPASLPEPRAPMAGLIVTRLRQAAGGTPARWASAAVGGGLAGAAAGAAGGLLLTAMPGSGAPLAVIPVLAAIGGGCGSAGGAGVGAGLSVGEASTRSKRSLALVCGAAAGGMLIGLTTQWLMRSTLTALVGITVDIGGGLEGLVIGSAAGLGYAFATRPRQSGGAMPTGPRQPQAPLLMAVMCGLAAFALTSSGRPLVGGTLHAIAREARGSQISLAPLGRLIGEPDFGPVSQALLGTGEGALFGLGLGFGLMYRPLSRTSHETLTAP